jgi:uncharacterized membrane protein
VATEISGPFVGIELSIYVLFALAVRRALRRSRWDLLALLAACMFGFAVEYLFVTPAADLPGWLPEWLRAALSSSGSGDSYVYGRFLVMLAGVPLWVPLGWGTIIHTAMGASESLGFALWSAPLADGLLASHLDFALDPVAQALGYWTWQLSNTGPPGLRTAFGIPLDNFLGWMMIVASLSLSLRIARAWLAKRNARLWLELCAAAAALVAALVLVFPVQAGFDWLYAHVTPVGAFLLVFGAAALATVSHLPWLRRDAPLDSFALGLVGYLHLFLLVMFLSHRVYASQPALLVFLPLLAVAGILAFAWSGLESLRALLRRRGASISPPEPALAATRTGQRQ